MMLSRSLLFVFAFMACVSPVYAQETLPEAASVLEQTSQPETAESVIPAAPVPTAEFAKSTFSAEKYPSLVFTYWEHVAIQDARNARGLVRAPTEAELTKDLKTTDQAPKPKPPPEQREIRLGGLLYHGKKDWVIWLNDKRVTPDALPVEVLDLNVYKEYIEMKWFDEWSNQIYPIRLRPHQRFNIDTRIFLPGN